MISEQWEQVKDLFEEALDLPPENRKTFLEQIRKLNPAAAEEVAQLLTSYEEAGNFLNEPWTLFPELLEEMDEEHRFSPGNVLCERFRVVQLIGKGGMGEVYEAWDQHLEEGVALKILRLEVSTHEAFTARFKREIQLARKVSHPNVCRIFDSFKHPLGDGIYISALSMELLRGQTLAQYLHTKGRFTVSEALPIGRQIIEGLSAIHAAGIVHRDLKPSNLILIPAGKDFRVKITDFGIAGQLPGAQAHAEATNASNLFGTPDYMAPEQLETGQTSIQSDIYSLGLILYEMVTGTKAFAEGQAWKRIYSRPDPPNKSLRNLPDNWNSTICSCLERSPIDRYENAQDVAANLASEASAPRLVKHIFRRVMSHKTARPTIFSLVIVTILALSTSAFRYLNQRGIRGNNEQVATAKVSTVFVAKIAVADPNYSGITTALKNQLAQSAEFQVDSVSSGNSIPVEKTSIPDLLIVSGSLEHKDVGYVLALAARFHSARPKTSTREFIAQTPSHLLSAISEASDWIRTLAGESATSISKRNKAVKDVSSANWRALRLFSEANQQASIEDRTTAISFLKEATAADPDFAMAHMRLADLLISNKQYQEGYSEWQKAFQLAERHQLSDREYLEITGQYYSDTGNLTAAEKQFRKLTNDFPLDDSAWAHLGSVLDSLDRKEDAAVAFSTASRLRPGHYGIMERLAQIHLLLGDYSQADALANSVNDLGGTEWAIWLHAESAFLQDKHDLALKEIRRLRSAPSEEWQSNSYSYAAAFLAEMGRLKDAQRELHEGLSFDAGHHMPSQTDKLLALAYLAYKTSDFQGAKQFALEASRLDGGPLRLAEAGSFLARAGFVNEAKDLLNRLQHLPYIPRVRFSIHRLLGEINLAEGDRDRAIENFRRAAELAKPREHQEYLAHSLMIDGRTQEAREMYFHLVTNSVRLLIDNDFAWPGLWNDSIFNYLLLSNAPGDNSVCDLARRFMRIGTSGDTPVRARAAQVLQKLHCSPN